MRNTINRFCGLLNLVNGKVESFAEKLKIKIKRQDTIISCTPFLLNLFLSISKIVRNLQ